MLTIGTSEKVVNPAIIISLADGQGFARTLKFRMLSSNKTRFIDEQHAAFGYLNKYWATLPKDKQIELFGLYQKLASLFEYTALHTILDQRLKPLIQKLVSYHQLSHVRSFINKTDIMIPDMATVYVHSVDNMYTPERTYILADYMKLVTMALAIRCMIPVWHEYLYSIKDQVGDQFKELFAFYLLRDTEYFDSDAMSKLELYITHSVKKAPVDQSFGMKGISEDDYPTYLLAQIVVKKLCIGELSSADTQRHIVSFCYKSLLQKISPRPTSPENTVRNKGDEGADGAEGSERSLLEQYKQLGDKSNGQIVEFEFSVRDPYEVCAKLANVPKEVLQDSLLTSQDLLENPPSEAQTMLLQWVMAPVIAPKALMHVPEPIRIKLMGVAQSVLYAQNHKYLALLSTCRRAVSGESYVVPDSDSRMGIRQEYVQKLIELYPQTTPRHTNMKDEKAKYHIFAAIDKMLAYIDKYSWRITASPHLVKEIIGRPTTSLPIIGDVRNEIARYIIDIGQRTTESYK